MLKKTILGGAVLLSLGGCGGNRDVGEARNELKIYGGSKVGENDQVARYTVVLQQNNRPICTGVLIAPDLVLTAAHCFYLVNASRPATVGFGLSAKDSKPIAVAQFVPNENFDSAAGQVGGTELEVNDIGLIRLASPAPEQYKPVAMLKRDDALQVGEPVVLAGYGRTEVSTGLFGLGTVLGDLYQVETELVVQSEKAKEIWVGNTPGKSACNGDSGGPALVMRNQQLKLIGVTSRGRDCKSEVIYTDVRFFQDWIEKTAASI